MTLRTKRIIRSVAELNAQAALARLPKLCVPCGGSGNHFYMRDGKPTWETCANCEGRGVA